MTGTGTLKTIHVAPEAEAEMEARERAEALAGRGLRGDRYFRGEGTFSDGEREESGRDLTLVEGEALDAIAREANVHLDPGAHRRNLTTRGVALNHLVGERFRVGEVLCRGDRLCEPCSHLAALTVEEALPALVHRGGLRVDVLESGTIRVGDAVERV
ncbi:sulfurase [Halobacteriales archaeon QS_3_64_16]|nr:MAG: sulfurase [Halobacteriales archaeon QS_3_64_16]